MGPGRRAFPDSLLVAPPRLVPGYARAAGSSVAVTRESRVGPGGGAAAAWVGDQLGHAHVPIAPERPPRLDQAIELGGEAIEGSPGRLVDQRAVAKPLVGCRDHQLRQLNDQGIEGRQAVAQGILAPFAIGAAGGHRHDRHRLFGQRLRPRPAQPIERVLEKARNILVVFGRGDQHAVGQAALVEQLLDAGRQVLDLEILVEKRQAQVGEHEQGEPVQPFPGELDERRVVGCGTQRSGDAEHSRHDSAIRHGAVDRPDGARHL
jgi:hypothetical protein